MHAHITNAIIYQFCSPTACDRLRVRQLHAFDFYIAYSLSTSPTNFFSPRPMAMKSASWRHNNTSMSCSIAQHHSMQNLMCKKFFEQNKNTRRSSTTPTRCSLTDDCSSLTTCNANQRLLRTQQQNSCVRTISKRTKRIDLHAISSAMQCNMIILAWSISMWSCFSMHNAIPTDP